MKKVLGLAFLLVALAPAAGAADGAWYNGIYFGGGVGAGRIEADLVQLDLMPRNGENPPVFEPIESSTFKKTAFTGKLFAGYRIFKYLAIEGGFTTFEDVDRQYCFVDDTGECTESRGEAQGAESAISSSAWTVELPTEGWSAYVVGLLPFGNDDAFEVFLKVGAIAWETEAAAYEKIVGNFVPEKDPLVPPTNVPLSKKLDGTDLATGIGLNFNHPSGVTVRSEFEYFDIGEFDKSYLLSFSAIYNF